MDRASDSGSEGWGFESLPVCHEKGFKSKDLRPFSCIYATIIAHLSNSLLLFQSKFQSTAGGSSKYRP